MSCNGVVVPMPVQQGEFTQQEAEGHAKPETVEAKGNAVLPLEPARKEQLSDASFAQPLSVSNTLGLSRHRASSEYQTWRDQDSSQRCRSLA